IVLLVFELSMGLEHPLFLYGRTPEVALSDMAGAGASGAAAWWFRLFWASAALLLLVAVQLLWPRGTETRLAPRLRRIRWKRASGLAAAASILFVLSGSWVVYNTLILNPFRSSLDSERYFADYEKRYFRYADLPQPVVRHVELNVALYPERTLAEVRGRYRLVNETASPIAEVHVRLLNPGVELVALDFPAARLESDDKAFGYRIYRLDRPMAPG